MKFMSVAAAITIMALAGCKPKEVQLYEKGVASFSNEWQRDAAIQLLKQSGDLGYGRAYAFLMEKELSEAQQLVKIRPSIAYEKKVERIKSAIDAYEKANKYLACAKGAGWADEGDVEAKIDNGARKADALLNVVYAQNAMKEVQVVADEVAANTVGTIRKMKKLIDALGRAEVLYANAIASGDVSQKTNVEMIQEKLVQAKAELARAETQRVIEEELKSAESKLKAAVLYSLDSSLSAKQNLEEVNMYLQIVEEAASSCKRASERGETNLVVELQKRIESKKLELATYAEKLEGEVKAEEAEEKRLAEERRLKEDAEKAEQKRIAEERRQKEEEELQETIRRQSAEYCLDLGDTLTVGAMREIVASLTYKSNTGNDIRDSQNEERERGRFKGRRAHIVGQIKRVDTGWFGGVNIWVTSNGMSVKCGFGQMSKDEGARYSNGEKISVVGTIDGTGGFMDDLSITNCRVE